MLHGFEPHVPAESAGMSNSCALYIYSVIDNVVPMISFSSI